MKAFKKISLNHRPHISFKLKYKMNIKHFLLFRNFIFHFKVLFLWIDHVLNIYCTTHYKTKILYNTNILYTKYMYKKMLWNSKFSIIWINCLKKRGYSAVYMRYYIISTKKTFSCFFFLNWNSQKNSSFFILLWNAYRILSFLLFIF